MFRYAVLLVALFSRLEIASAAMPSAADLIEKYADTQNKICSFIIKSDNLTVGEVLLPGSKSTAEMTTAAEIRFDGERISLRSRVWGKLPGSARFITQDQARYTSKLWDGQNYYTYTGVRTELNQARLIIDREKNEVRNKTKLSRGSSSNYALGYFYGDDDRIDTVLKEAKTTQVRDRLERVGNSACYVIDAVTERGRYTLWIDPEHGYNIARATVEKSEGDLCYNAGPLSEGEHSRAHLDNVRFKQIDGVWMPVESDYKLKVEGSPGTGVFWSDTHYKATEVILNPDHDALGSFVPDDIPDGVRVYVNGSMGIKYTWQNGKLIPDVDEEVIEQLDEITDEIMKKDLGLQLDAALQQPPPQTLTAAEVLARYRQGQQKLEAFAANAQTEIQYADIKADTTQGQNQNSEFKTDGRKLLCRIHSWDNIFTTRDSPARRSFLWDTNSLIQYEKAGEHDEGTVYITKDHNRKEELLTTHYKGAPLLGICPADYQRIDAVLAKAAKISLHNQTETINKSPCYVIDAQTERGRYSLWFDPQHGYNIAKIQLQREKGQIIYNNRPAKNAFSFTMDNVRFEKFEAVWVPVEAHMSLTEDNETAAWTHKRTQVLVNPDQDRLGTFTPDDIPNGTRVVIPGQYKKYSWQNGKAVTEKGKSVNF